MNFDGININNELKIRIESAAAAGKLPHAVILEGGSENDRLNLARLLAKAQVCSGESIPCCSCNDCIKAEKGIHPDIFQALAQEGSTEPLKVDAIRDIRANAFVYPNEAQRRVFILHNMQFANEQAQNALLKILEEPPEFVRFILTAPVSSVMLITILSRAAVFSLGQQLGDTLNAKHAQACEKAAAIAKALISPNEFDLMTETGIFEKDAELLVLVLAQLRLIFRDAIARKQSPAATLLSSSQDNAVLLSRSCTVPQLMALMQAVDALEKAENQNANKALLITRFCSTMRKAVNK